MNLIAKIKVLSAVIAGLLIGEGMLVGQQVILSGGGDSVTEDASLHYSIGQVAQNEMSGDMISLIEGVQQPFEVSVSTMENHPEIRVMGRVYPNPTTDVVTIELDIAIPDLQHALMVQLLDVNGRILLQETLDGEVHQVGMNRFPDGSYVIRILARGGAVLNFKLIKH